MVQVKYVTLYANVLSEIFLFYLIQLHVGAHLCVK